MQTSLLPFSVALVGALLTIAATLWTNNRQQRIANFKERQQIYASLAGKNQVRRQILVSRFEALINSDFHEQLWRLRGEDAKSLDLDETRRWMSKSEELALEFARVNQTFFESVGAARTSFPPSAELTRLTDKLFKFRPPTRATLPEKITLHTLDKWAEEAVRQTQVLIDQEFGDPLDALLKHLEANMDSKL